MREGKACVRALIDSHFAGSISPSREQTMRAHLPGCEACRRYYGRHLVLAKLEPRAAGPEARIAVGLGLRPSRQRVPAWSVAVALCAAALLLAFVPMARSRESGFAARGVLGAAKPQFFVYRIDPTRRLEPHGSIIKATDELAFAYANPTGFRRLFVYGVDEHRHVYWYYPAWSSPADDPHALTVPSGPEVRELPEAIRHEIDGRELTIHAVFLDDDTSVRRVERLVHDVRSPGDALPIAGAYEERLSLTVEP